MNTPQCVGCRHFDFFTGSPGYSEMTPAQEWSMDCSKGFFSMYGYDVTEADYRANLARAPECPDFAEWRPPPPPPPPFQLTGQGLVKLVNGLALAHAVILGHPTEAGLVDADDFVVAPRELPICKTHDGVTARWTADPVRWPIPYDGVTSFQAVAIYDPADLVVVAFQNYPGRRDCRKGDTINLAWGGKDDRELATIGPDP